MVSSSSCSSSSSMKPTSPSQMISRPGLYQLADDFILDYVYETEETPLAWFEEVVDRFHFMVPDSPTEEDFDRLARRVFNLYRGNLVLRATAQADAAPQEWGFTAEEWSVERASFQQFLWTYIKMCYSRSWAIGETIRNRYPQHLTVNYYPPLTVVLPHELTFSQFRKSIQHKSVKPNPPNTNGYFHPDVST